MEVVDSVELTPSAASDQKLALLATPGGEQISEAQGCFPFLLRWLGLLLSYSCYPTPYCMAVCNNELAVVARQQRTADCSNNAQLPFELLRTRVLLTDYTHAGEQFGHLEVRLHSQSLALISVCRDNGQFRRS
jgi:hypothetical protein